jgi:small acid-soluble spore protein F (minor alpha/beta-type SASP)
VVVIGKIMSEATKQKLGDRLGVGDIVRREGWGAVPARQCGMLVKEAVKLAEEQMRR